MRNGLKLSARVTLALGCVCFALVPTTFCRAVPVDDLLQSLHANSDVSDFAHVLGPEEVQQIQARCKQLRERTGAQFAVVTVKSLLGDSIEDFANRLFTQWGIGQADKDNGLLLVVALDDHKFRLEVGYGNEPIIPDLLANRILKEELPSRFRQQQYGAGLLAAVNRICERIEADQPATPQELQQGPHKPSEIATMVGFLAIFVGVGATIFGTGAASRMVALLGFGLIFAGFPMAIAYTFAGFWALLLHIPVAVLGFIFGWVSATSGRGGPGGRGGGTTFDNGGWSWAPTSTMGDWSSSSGGFSSGWGGFDGGSSGGGGASGSW